MKRLILSSAVLSIIAFSSCKKCYECSTDLPITVNGQVVGTTPYTTEECGRGTIIKQKVESLEEEGYTCTKK